MRPFLVLLILVFLTLSLSGQNYFFRQYSGTEGLSAPFVYDINQDNQGFIWIGTPDGLYRFNGIEFELYTIEEGISENFVTKIFKDSKGRIWLGHSNGSVSLQFIPRLLTVEKIVNAARMVEQLPDCNAAVHMWIRR